MLHQWVRRVFLKTLVLHQWFENPIRNTSAASMIRKSDFPDFRLGLSLGKKDLFWELDIWFWETSKTKFSKSTRNVKFPTYNFQIQGVAHWFGKLYLPIIGAW
jgi:hypothetical protein